MIISWESTPVVWQFGLDAILWQEQPLASATEHDQLLISFYHPLRENDSYEWFRLKLNKAGETFSPGALI